MTDLLQRLKDARQRGEAAAIEPAELPADPAAAYALALSDPARVAAWKIGGANPWSRAAFGNDEVFFGALFEDELFVETASVAVGALNSPLAEPEIMLEIADPAAGMPQAAFSRMGLGFEIPATVLPEDCKQLLAGQIADRAGAGALWVGAVQPFDEPRLRRPFDSAFCHNDGKPVAGTSENVLGGPLAAAAEFLALARRHGAPLEAGQWIASGGLNPAVAIKPGDSLRFAALGGEVRLEIR
ncbi:MAG: hypothetical protein ACLFQL_03640 [Paracoccaceae bacterium]